MIDFQQKRKINKIMYSKISLVILLILVIFIGKSAWDIYQKYRLSANNYKEIKNDYESLKSRKDMLESGINRLQTENGIEEEIRDKFNVAKPGETVVVVVNNSSSSSSTVNDQKKSILNLWGIIKW